jgi:hypothetical protein
VKQYNYDLPSSSHIVKSTQQFSQAECKNDG